MQNNLNEITEHDLKRKGIFIGDRAFVLIPTFTSHHENSIRIARGYTIYDSEGADQRDTFYGDDIGSLSEDDYYIQEALFTSPVYNNLIRFIWDVSLTTESVLADMIDNGNSDGWWYSKPGNTSLYILSNYAKTKSNYPSYLLPFLSGVNDEDLIWSAIDKLDFDSVIKKSEKNPILALIDEIIKFKPNNKSKSI